VAASAEPTPALSPLDRAAALDAADPLAAFRDRFVIADPDLVYLDGNSLGRLPKATVARLSRVVGDEWGSELIRGWDHWLDEPARVGDLIAPLIGAAPGQVIVSDSTTVNFYKLAVAALDARPGRHVVITDRDNFPTDRYVLEGLTRARNLEIDWLEPDPVGGPTVDAIATALARGDGDVALVTLTHVNYRSAAIADMSAITEAAHEAGALVLWDLSHSAGAVDVPLDDAGADLAVGCTYKFLCGGPGAPAYLYVSNALQAELRNPIQGWFGQRDQFAMAQGYDPAPGVGQWLAGTPGMIAIAAVEEGVKLVAEAGIDRIRAKGIALTEFAIELVDTKLAAVGFSVGSPRDPATRGAHVAIRHRAAKRLTGELIANGVVPDFREPDSIRFGMSPLTTTFTEVARGVEQLSRLVR
jgi:kynureninase